MSKKHVSHNHFCFIKDVVSRIIIINLIISEHKKQIVPQCLQNDRMLEKFEVHKIFKSYYITKETSFIGEIFLKMQDRLIL